MHRVPLSIAPGTGRFMRCLVAVAVLLAALAAVLTAQVRDIAAARTLVELVTLDSTIRLDVKYATHDNFMGRPMYAQARVFLQRPAAEAVVRAHCSLAAKGFGLLVFDGYRPWAVTKKFWDETPPVQRKFVGNPRKGSKHNRGCAVDLTLFDLTTGQEVSMPSRYDDFSDKASSSYQGGTPEQRTRRALLRAVMEREGFRVEPSEWWHFDYKDWRNYPLLDIPFEKIPPR
ncbi:MAG TPA: M15 family metallopeptidase [Bacteroidota bacterium]|nr:M15 family metallopeptidase [Bacteroidota bacterium]